MSIPCLIISYARGSNVLSLIQSLRDQGISTFYIAIDGPRDISVRDVQAELLHEIEQLQNKDGLSINLWSRDRNLGIAVSVISALDWFFSHEEFGMVLEDDLIVSSDFTKFIVQNFKSRTPGVSIISGNRFFPNPIVAFESSYPATWGWATWRSEWNQMRDLITQRPKIRLGLLLRSDYQFWLVGSLRVLMRYVDTWDIPVALYMLNNSKYSLLPPVNLISNIGFDNYASHTFEENFPLGIPLENYTSYEVSILESDRRLYDRDLRRQVFNVRCRHRLLGLHILVLHIALIFKGNLLEKDLNAVTIPG